MEARRSPAPSADAGQPRITTRLKSTRMKAAAVAAGAEAKAGAPAAGDRSRTKRAADRASAPRKVGSIEEGPVFKYPCKGGEPPAEFVVKRLRETRLMRAGAFILRMPQVGGRSWHPYVQDFREKLDSHTVLTVSMNPAEWDMGRHASEEAQYMQVRDFQKRADELVRDFEPLEVDKVGTQMHHALATKRNIPTRYVNESTTLPKWIYDGTCKYSEFMLENVVRDPQCLFHAVTDRISGINVPWLYIGMPWTFFCMHLEDELLGSFNYVSYGQPKVWYVLAPEDRGRLQEYVKEKYPHLLGEGSECAEGPLPAKTLFFDPAELVAAGFRVTRLVQRPGDIVVTDYGAFHQGVNLGFNIAESVNFAWADWLDVWAQGERVGDLLRCRPSGINVQKVLTRMALAKPDDIRCWPELAALQNNPKYRNALSVVLEEELAGRARARALFEREAALRAHRDLCREHKVGVINAEVDGCCACHRRAALSHFLCSGPVSCKTRSACVRHVDAMRCVMEGRHGCQLQVTIDTPELHRLAARFPRIAEAGPAKRARAARGFGDDFDVELRPGQRSRRAEEEKRPGEKRAEEPRPEEPSRVDRPRRRGLPPKALLDSVVPAPPPPPAPGPATLAATRTRRSDPLALLRAPSPAAPSPSPRASPSPSPPPARRGGGAAAARARGTGRPRGRPRLFPRPEGRPAPAAASPSPAPAARGRGRGRPRGRGRGSLAGRPAAKAASPESSRDSPAPMADVGAPAELPPAPRLPPFLPPAPAEFSLTIS